MDARIILAGQQPNLINVLAQSGAAAQQQNEITRQNALQSMYQQQGPGILAGDPNAMNALAQFDPAQALNIQGARQDMTIQQQKMDMLSREEKRALEDRAAQMTAQERAAAAAQVEDAVKMGMAIQSPEQWDQVMASEAPDLVGQFANREALAAKYMSMAEILKRQEPPKIDLTADQQNYQFYSAQEAEAGRKPLSFNEWNLQSRRAGATQVNVGSQSPQDLAKRNAGIKADNVNTVVEDIRNTDAGATLPTTGAVGGLLSTIGGTAAGDIAANLETLRAAASFGSLQAMRQASPTGGALGAVSDTEVKLLSAELAALEQSQSREQFFRNLDRFQKVYNEIVNGPQASNIPPAPPESAPIEDLSDDDLLRKYGG